MFENILANISKVVSLTGEEEELLTSQLICRQIPRKTVLLRAGEICQFEGYIQKGCVRVYCMDEGGNEVTIIFAVEDWWISDIASFQYQVPSALYMETLEDSEIYMLTPEKKEKLLQAVPLFERLFRMLVQRRLSTLQERLVDTITKSAADRYVEFVAKYPTIINRVPQYYIASYLGVSPEFVSKIRTRLAKQGKHLSEE